MKLISVHVYRPVPLLYIRTHSVALPVLNFVIIYSVLSIGFKLDY